MNNIIETSQNQNNPAESSLEDFKQLLLEMRAITELDTHLHRMVCEFQRSIDDNAAKIIYIYFSLMNDGNTRIALDFEYLYKKWAFKWNSLLMLNQADSGKRCSADAFKNVIDKGIEALKANKYDRIFEMRASDTITASGGTSKPFILRKEEPYIWMYTSRFFDAKCIIESHIHQLFENGNQHRALPSVKKEQKLIEFSQKELQPYCDIQLKQGQLDAIYRGLSENLIITGGPGTGKTTAICFLLWQLLKENPEMLSWNIYLAAPSGKAADRMRESVTDNLKILHDHTENGIRAIEKIRGLESYTIHRLLKFSPKTCGFSMNEKNPFADESIFIIDEASMIDISLFASFLQAVPEGARIYILGDPEQLPSVDAGAVLGELLNASSKYVVKLTESNRFNDQSEIGKLSHSIQNLETVPVFNKFAKSDDYWGTESDDEIYYNKHESLDCIHYIKISEKSDPKAQTKDIESILKEWTIRFYKKVVELANEIDLKRSLDEQTDKLDALWQASIHAKILSAEKKGIRGVDAINHSVIKHLKKPANAHFTGQLLMLNKNQSMYKLYNGDSGVVIQSTKDNQFYILLKKPHTEEGTVKDYIVYPLSMLSKDTLENAFAITIHKSQGSGYPHVMIFLPERIGHPLLNRQIVYTGITRTMSQSVTIVSSQEAFKSACETVIERDTGIVLL